MNYVYILTNKYNTVLYVGMTKDLRRRIKEHTKESASGFTKKYNVCKLVYFEEFQNRDEAASRERQLKRWTRTKKISLIEKANPSWIDLLD
ncbi:MAG: GIY-YIG nuclease family protein [Clostridia bacterium]|nr:GIY-YIG nuclease family protein [Clostridia bacterium]